ACDHRGELCSGACLSEFSLSKPRLERRLCVMESWCRMNSQIAHKRDYLETSARIGRRIVDEAILHDGCFNWVGAQPIERQGTEHQAPLTYKALGPELYSGTSGIALFLAELFAITNDASTRSTALGAARQAFSRLDSTPPSSRPGLFN